MQDSVLGGSSPLEAFTVYTAQNEQVKKKESAQLERKIPWPRYTKSHTVKQEMKFPLFVFEEPRHA